MSKPIKSEAEVRAMLAEVYRAAPDVSDLDGEPGEGIYDTLLWFLGDRDDSDLLRHIRD